MVLSTYIIVEWVKTLLENFAKRQSTYLVHGTKKRQEGLIGVQYLGNQLRRTRSQGSFTSFRDSIRSSKLPMWNVIISGQSTYRTVKEIRDVLIVDRDDLIVEIDVILPRASTLHFAHDLGETIQCMLER